MSTGVCVHATTILDIFSLIDLNLSNDSVLKDCLTQQYLIRVLMSS
jgi:hypothetical protein